MSFVVWNKVLDLQYKELADWRKDYPRVAEWDRKLREMPSVARCMKTWVGYIEEIN